MNIANDISKNLTCSLDIIVHPQNEVQINNYFKNSIINSNLLGKIIILYY